jgi:hypothetical protein
MRRALDRVWRRLPLLLLLIVGPADSALAQQPPTDKRVNQNARAIADFQEEVQEYLELHEKLERKLPELPREPTPEDIDQRQRALAALIQKARRSAKQGDIFERDVRPVIRRLLYGVFTGPEGKQLRTSINDENPTGAVKLQINGRYPDTFPYSTVPAQVLRILPPLPRELEYRFIDTTLILLDAHAHIIVDYMTGAVPR